MADSNPDTGTTEAPPVEPPTENGDISAGVAKAADDIEEEIRAPTPEPPPEPAPPEQARASTPPNEDARYSDRLPDGDRQMRDEERERDAWEAERRKLPLSVEVTWHDFESFKNRYSDEEGLAIIEVLKGHPQIHQELVRETAARQSRRTKKGRRGVGLLEPLRGSEEDAGWIQRIRIQSPVLLRLMSRLSGHGDDWPTQIPRVFYQPFRNFHFYLPQMKECLQLIEARLAEAEASRDAAGASSTGDDPNQPREDDHLAPPHPDMHGDDLDNVSDDGSVLGIFEEGPLDPAQAVAGDLVNTQVAASHIRKYVEFAEQYVEPYWKRAGGATKRKLRFEELLMVFREGDLLYLPPVSETSQGSTDEDKKATANMTQRVWRCYGYGVSQIDDETPDDTAPAKETQRVLGVWAYYVDWDGSSYIPVHHTFDIVQYRGDKDVTSFSIYPLRFAKDADKKKATMLEQGEWFQRAIKLKHLYCEGWSFTHGPTGASGHADDMRSEHVEGEVIIDFAEGYKSEPALGPGPSDWKRGLLSAEDSDWPHGIDILSIRHWRRSETGQLKVVGEIVERSQRNEYFGGRKISETLKARPITKAYDEGNKVTSIDDDDDIILLPSRVVAYSFRERRFFMLAAKDLREIPPSEKDTFRDLKIENEHKWMVRSLVQNHLEKQVVQKARPDVSLDQDIIRGKGSGLFILLHGVPGVGKTATAEAVAQANRKPLFVITCGDLGFTPREVEGGLRDIFRLAQLWDCILLLDEADVFLSRRELGDLKRNALVSVFLRVLEYYTGILFLTTNRVGTLDEAFKSRIHVSLYYPPLTRAQTLAIFKVNIRKLHDIEAEKQKASDADPATPAKPRLAVNEESILRFAARHYDAHDQHREKRWNGRQIRNAFQIAHSLAFFESQDEARDLVDADNERDDDRASSAGVATLKPDSSTVLDHVQFTKVAKAIEKFEDYLYEATAATDKDRALKARTRADDFNPRYSGHDSAAYSPRYQDQPGSFQDYPDYYPPQRHRGSGSYRGPPPRRSDHRSPTDDGYPPTPTGRGVPQGRRRGGRGGNRSVDSTYLSPPSQDNLQPPAPRGQGRGQGHPRRGTSERSFERGGGNVQDGGLDAEDEGLGEEYADDYDTYGRGSRGSYYGDEGDDYDDQDRKYYER